ncbi:MAG TPA: pyridoxamine 5'-phosphate oxidase [Flavobacterium sp.]|nr:pyridoxamine 5'-phosphate oxidase [Flavobacterium sp.]
MKDLSQYRKSYEKSQMTEANIPNAPMELFSEWFQEIENSGGESEINAMTVSTIGIDKFPKARVVLLKQFSPEGFTFYTNYKSEKGRAIAKNPNVCLSFFWHSAERQVIIKGVAEKVSAETSDIYFASRPEGSKLGAIVSNQSEVVSSRTELEEKLAVLEMEYLGKEIPRPKHWGGYLVRPVEVEFWQGRANRLHDRIRYKKKKDAVWEILRLAP